MGALQGWGLTGRLFAKNFGNLGDKIAETVASFDPETATQVDRDRLQDSLMETAQKLSAAQKSFDQDHQTVIALQALIGSDQNVATALMAKLTAGQIDEATVTLFCDELEANKAKLPGEQQEEVDSKQFVTELKAIVDGMSSQLAEFDARAKKATQELARAQGQRDLQQTRLDRQGELDGLKNLGSNSSALNALSRKADRISSEAGGMKIVADINQKPVDQAASIDEIRKSVAVNTGETTMERLARLTGKATTETTT